MPSASSSPADPDSVHSQTARLACWFTGGGGSRRSPTTAVPLLRMAQKRNAVEKAEAEWNSRKQAALNVHVQQWGNTGLIGTTEEVAAIGPGPKVTALLRWWRENGEEGAECRSVSGGGRSTGDGTTTPEPAGQHHAEDGPVKAVDSESEPVAEEQDDENQEHAAPADNVDEVNVAPISASEASINRNAGVGNSC